MFKIYVSSTYKDLKTCRQKVNDAIRMLGHVDTAMEHYVAESRSSVTKCLSDVEDCDVYVGIFADRYGWVPPGGKLSITELEYRQAVKSNKDILIFMTDRSVKSWRFADAEGSEAAKKLNRLRSELSSGKYTQAIFSSCDELQAKVIASIANLTKPLLTPTDLKREEDLLKRINDKNTAIRSRAKQSLIDMGSTQYAAVLLGRIKKPTKNEQRRIQDIKELLDITAKNSGVMPLLRVLLTYEDPVTKAQVIYQLGQQALAGKQIDRDTTYAILDLSSDSDSSVRREVAHVTWKIFRLLQPEDDRRLFEKMKTCLYELHHDSNIDVRTVAAYSISRLSREGLM